MSNLDRGTRLHVKEVISLLWIVVMFSMVFADILGFITPGSLQEMMTGYAGKMKITQSMLFIFAILLEIPIAMIFLSRVLKKALNRILNIAASIITIVFVIAGGSTTLHYIFFASIETVCMLAIIVMCIKWKEE